MTHPSFNRALPGGRTDFTFASALRCVYVPRSQTKHPPIMSSTLGGRKHPTIPDRWRKSASVACLFLALALSPDRLGAALQFDVFVGYGNDYFVREANWFPVTCEIHNDGPAFTGVIELTTARSGRENVRKIVVELPTNTRKRIVIPVFGSGGSNGAWDAQLRDEKNKVVAESLGIRAGADMAWNARLMGALSRTHQGTPRLPAVPRNVLSVQPRAARFRAPVFPDNALALEGLDTFYLNSELALDLKIEQQQALLAWLHAGGHLIVGVESATDVNGTPWLNALMPCDVSGGATVAATDAFHAWLTRGADRGAPAPAWRHAKTPADDPYVKLKADPNFIGQEFRIVECAPREASVDLALGGKPLILSASRGRGTVTALAFSPEKAPFPAWNNLDWFWAHMMKLSPEVFDDTSQIYYASQSIDGVFGGMIDSKQVRKLPVSWLLLLLVVYLLVIGPIDQWWLKKINRQMLTWITFPCYVVLFSVLIYWIGFMLRAGESEWNELHVVDVHQRGGKAELRGRTYASIYSPSNAKYKLAGLQPVAALRGEFVGSRIGGQDTSRSSIVQKGNSYDAEVYVPVWTSQLFVNDWWEPAALPLKAVVKQEGANITGNVANLLPRALSDVRVVFNDRIYTVGDVGAGKVKDFSFTSLNGASLQSFVREHAGQFSQVVNQRRTAFGANTARMSLNVPLSSMAACFVDELTVNDKSNRGSQDRFITPSGFELSRLAKLGAAFVFAWDADNSPTAKMNQFSPRRSHADTLLRLSVRVDSDG